MDMNKWEGRSHHGVMGCEKVYHISSDARQWPAHLPGAWATHRCGAPGACDCACPFNVLKRMLVQCNSDCQPLLPEASGGGPAPAAPAPALHPHHCTATGCPMVEGQLQQARMATALLQREAAWEGCCLRCCRHLCQCWCRLQQPMFHCCHCRFLLLPPC